MPVINLDLEKRQSAGGSEGQTLEAGSCTDSVASGFWVPHSEVRICNDKNDPTSSAPHNLNLHPCVTIDPTSYRHQSKVVSKLRCFAGRASFGGFAFNGLVSQPFPVVRHHRKGRKKGLGRVPAEGCGHSRDDGNQAHTLGKMLLPQ
jgi:hypothetical protein